MARRTSSRLARLGARLGRARSGGALAAGTVAIVSAVAVGRAIRGRASHGNVEPAAGAVESSPSDDRPDDVRVVARRHIALAVEELRSVDGNADGAVHEARKRLKRARAALRLARPELDDATYRRDNAALRDAGRLLSEIRDARVLLDSLDALMARYADKLPEGAFARLCEALEAEHAAHLARLSHDGRVLVDVATELDRTSAAVAAWPLADGARPADLGPGFERIYRRGRRALRAATKKPTPERLHELRKRTKDVWHAAETAEPVAPKRMRKLAKRAHRVADLAGEDHDLAVLADFAGEHRELLSGKERKLLAKLIERRRSRLGDAALEKARRLYARKPAELRRWFGAARS